MALMQDEGCRMQGEGYQSVPVDWGINSARKRAFFRLLRNVTGTGPT